MNREEILSYLDKEFGMDLNKISLRCVKIKKSEAYQSILTETDYMPQDQNFTLSERIYHIIYNIHSRPTCKNPNCDNPVRFNSLFKGYFEYCCGGCASKDPEIRKKVEETSLRKFGSKCNFQNEETKKKTKETCLRKYGVENPIQSQIIQEKIQQTSLERFGVSHCFQSEQVKEKIRNTNIERYGDASPMKNLDIQEKAKNTNLERRGCEYPTQDSKVIDKSRQTCMERYGVDSQTKTKETQDKIRNTNIQRYNAKHAMCKQTTKDKHSSTMILRYGVVNPSQNFELRQKALRTMKKKYGVEYAIHREDFKLKIQTSKLNHRLKNMIVFLNSLGLELTSPNIQPEIYSYEYKCKECGCVFKQNVYTLRKDGACPKCYPQPKSRQQNEIINFIRDELNLVAYSDIRSIISPLELDIYIPDKKIAIEYNGIYWHSTAMISDPNYHLNKTIKCQEQGIRLIHIFEDEWTQKPDIVKNRLKQILNIKDNRRVIYARKCTIREISPQEKNQFLDTYHIQGKDNSVIKLGAFYEDELISVMTFSHNNVSKGSKNNDPTIWELNRFCVKSDYIVTGIASKLLSYFKKTYQWSQIFSYADRRWSQGEVYQKLGFEFSHNTGINYWYSRGFDRIHRFSLRKRPDEPKDKTEFELRDAEGYVRIYDCGSMKYIMYNK